MWETLKVDILSTHAVVTLNRPEVRNALNLTMIEELRRAFQGLGAARGVRAILLQGEGSSFCAGGDLNWLRASLTGTREESVDETLRLGKMLLTIFRCPRPVIARVHGAAFGGGVGLASACDLVIAEESTTFCFSEVTLGLLPAVISPFVLQKVLPGHARRYFTTAERFCADRARAIGLVSETAAGLEVMDEAVARWIRQFAGNGPEAMGRAKALTDPYTDAEWEATLRDMAERLADRRSSEEGQEGIRAFLEKRAPSWYSGDSARVP